MDGTPKYHVSCLLSIRIFAPPGASFQINVRPPLRMVSGVSCNRKSRSARCWRRWLGGDAAAPVVPLRFGRCLGCVVKVFGEISDVIPSDAHRMARFQWCTWENAESAKIPIHPGFSCFFTILSALNHCKRFLRRLRFVWVVPVGYLWWNPWCNARKPVKNKQNALTNQSKGDTNTGTRRMCHAGHINRAGIRTRYASRYKQLPTPTHATVVHARASIICEAAALCWRVARSLPLFTDVFRSIESY